MNQTTIPKGEQYYLSIFLPLTNNIEPSRQFTYVTMIN